MSTPENPEPSFFNADDVPPDHPILQRPTTQLSLDMIVEAARLVRSHPGNPEIQRFATPVATLRMTAEEYDALIELCRIAAKKN